jgi:hypothetical protein
MAQSTVLRHIPLLFYRPGEFWTKVSDKLPVYCTKALLFIGILSLLSAAAGIGGRFLYSISEPGLLDFLPEAVAAFLVPPAVLFFTSLVAYLLVGRKKCSSYRRMVTLIALSMIPLLSVWTLIMLIRYLFFFGLLGLFSLYVFRSGLKTIMKFDGKKATVITGLVFFISLPFYIFCDLLCRYLIVTFVLYGG